MKPTRFASSSKHMLDRLSLKCNRQHEHQQLVGGELGPQLSIPRSSLSNFCEGFATPPTPLPIMLNQKVFILTKANMITNLFRLSSVPKGFEMSKLLFHFSSKNRNCNSASTKFRYPLSMPTAPRPIPALSGETATATSTLTTRCQLTTSGKRWWTRWLTFARKFSSVLSLKMQSLTLTVSLFPADG